eukprot:jgi/Tetstr1/443452/TSEL_031463.t1
MGTGAQNASVDGPCHTPTSQGLKSTLQAKRAGGIIKHNTNAVKNLTATKAVPGDNVDEGGSPEPPDKKGKQPAKPAAGGLTQGRGGAGARAGGGALGSRAGRRAAVAAAATRDPTKPDELCWLNAADKKQSNADKERKRPVKKRRGKKLTVAESEAEATRSSKRPVPRARKNKNKQ